MLHHLLVGIDMQITSFDVITIYYISLQFLLIKKIDVTIEFVKHLSPKYHNICIQNRND